MGFNLYESHYNVGMWQKYDEKRKLYLQSADFEDYALIDMDSIWKDKKKAFGHYASQEKIYRSRCIKQADIIALMSIFPEKFTEEQLRVGLQGMLMNLKNTAPF